MIEYKNNAAEIINQYDDGIVKDSLLELVNFVVNRKK